MRVTIIKDDNTVIIDGEARTVNCAALPEEFHALQWDGVRGEVEYRTLTCAHCSVRSKKPNATISDLSPYKAIVDGWHAAGPQS